MGSPVGWGRYGLPAARQLSTRRRRQLSRHWKPVERKFAELLGCERIPVSGRTRGWAPDLEHPELAPEIKSRKRMPILLREGMDQAVKAAVWAEKRGQDKMPILFIHEDGTNYDNALVVVRLKDAREWWGIGDRC